MKLSHEHHLHSHGQITSRHGVSGGGPLTYVSYLEGTKGITKLHIHNIYSLSTNKIVETVYYYEVANSNSDFIQA